MSRATSSRWCPTPEQVMILEELYRAGIRAPNVTQIQKITCHLSYHGKIEGKNVFYWFQNHKAREKQKLRKKFNKQYCRNTQVQLISSTSFQILHGLGRSTSGLHEAPFCTCTSSSSVDGFLNRQGDEQMPKWAMNNCRWSKYGDEPSSNQMVRADGKAAVSNAGASATHHPPTPCFTKSPPPLRTLQLFPVKAATHLRKESSQLVNMEHTSL